MESAFPTDMRPNAHPSRRVLTLGPKIRSLFTLFTNWIEGRVEHTSNLYANERSGQVEGSYYFVATDGTICGLCTGMQVRR